MPAHDDGSMPNQGGSQIERDLFVVRISTYSFAAVVSLCSALCGFIVGFKYSVEFLLAYSHENKKPALTTSRILKEMLLGSGISMVAALLLGWVAGLILANLYNAAAQTTGGLRLRVREDTLAPAKPPRWHAWARKLGRLWARKS